MQRADYLKEMRKREREIVATQNEKYLRQYKIKMYVLWTVALAFNIAAGLSADSNAARIAFTYCTIWAIIQILKVE